AYTVDVTKPLCQRITIDKKMKNGKSFDYKEKYIVAINSYRGNGGGKHLTEGAGIKHEDLSSRIITSTPVDLRYYMMQWMKKKQTIKPETFTDWKLIPEDWTKPAGEKDYKRLFNL
ncbi:MAG: bifunctional metallophosphatase/5'-nucleotidase, partial [Dysgonamonadaceae bacterium]|nr:bifunctional metallophosphatase/5'-nucleotidase [Dysgonamonadaceae bacterium]